MKVHPEMREQFEEAMRYQMDWKRSMSPVQVWRGLHRQAVKEQFYLLDWSKPVYASTHKHSQFCYSNCSIKEGISFISERNL